LPAGPSSDMLMIMEILTIYSMAEGLGALGADAA
jgi:hypothetical protein